MSGLTGIYSKVCFGWFRMVDGVWRSWLARQYGVLEARGSSPRTPTMLKCVYDAGYGHFIV